MKSMYPPEGRKTLFRGILRRVSLILFVLLLCGGSALATHYRYGTISWKRVPGTCNIEITVKQAWRRSYFGAPIVGSNVNTGALSMTPLGGGGSVASSSIILQVTSINTVDDWFFGEFKTTYSLPNDSTDYLLAYSSCCRISSLQNNADGSFRSQSVVTACNKGNDSPVSTQLPIVKLPVGVSNNTFLVAGTDPNSDPISFRLATNAEAIGTNAPSFAINSSGMASFNTSSASVGALYNVFVTIEDTAGASTMADFLIEVVDSSAPPAFDFAVTPAPAPCYEVQPGDTVEFTVKAFDPDAGDMVFLSAVGLPIGAMLTPSLPTAGGNPDSTVFWWVPDTADIGTTVISFTAEDTSGVTTSTSVCITVSLKPIFAVPPTPAEGVHIIAECGDTIEFDVEAYDPDPMDSVRIFKVQGKSMGGAKIPLYPGAMFSPIPSPWGNPTSGQFHWVVDSSDWGHRHVFFTAEDGFGETTEHEVSILVNNPPHFLSMPDTCVKVDSLYVYDVEVNDKDTAYGDSLDLYAFGLPAWLTFVDHGNGRGLLMGTPGIGDVGLYGITIEAQDVFHHDNGTAIQMFVIEVKSDSILPPPPPDTNCVAQEIHIPSDSTWMRSTFIEMSPSGKDWTGATGLPAVGTYTIPAEIGQPYSWGGIPVLDSTQPIKAENNIRFYRKEFILAQATGVEARFRMNMDDGAEIYINGHLICREENSDISNWFGPSHDLRYSGGTSWTNGHLGNQTFDYISAPLMDTVFKEGVNTIEVALRNFQGVNNKGGFSLMFDAWVSCPEVMTVDSCVSDSSWMKSTVVTTATANKFPWPGVDSLPADATFSLPAEIGQPYPWFSIPSVPGSLPIRSDSYVTYFRKEFELIDHTGLNLRFQAYFDDNIEVYINGHMLMREQDIFGTSNFSGPWHDILFKADGTVDNGYSGGDAYDVVSTVDLDTVLLSGVNSLTVVLRNRKPMDKGGFSFRMDADKAGAPVLVKKKSTVDSKQIRPVISEDFKMHLYPNPTRGNVLLALPARSDIENVSLMMTDMQGRVLLKQDLRMSEVSIMELDLSSYTQGVYFLQLSGDGHQDIQRIVKY